MSVQYDDRIAHKFLNDFSVRDAIHAAPFANKTETLAGFFEMCTTRVNYTVLVESTIPYHKHNIARGARVLVYRYCGLPLRRLACFPLTFCCF